VYATYPGLCPVGIRARHQSSFTLSASIEGHWRIGEFNDRGDRWSLASIGASPFLAKHSKKRLLVTESPESDSGTLGLSVTALCCERRRRRIIDYLASKGCPIRKPPVKLSFMWMWGAWSRIGNLRWGSGLITWFR